MSEVQDVTKEEENPLADLVKSSLDKDYNKANEIFTNIFSVLEKKLGNIAFNIMPIITGTVVIKNI